MLSKGSLCGPLMWIITEKCLVLLKYTSRKRAYYNKLTVSDSLEHVLILSVILLGTCKIALSIKEMEQPV